MGNKSCSFGGQGRRRLFCVLAALMCFVALVAMVCSSKIAYADEEELTGSEVVAETLSEGDASDVAFMYITSSQFSVSEEQYAVIAFSSTVSNARLETMNVETGSIEVIEPISVNENAALFALSFSDSSVYRISRVQYTSNEVDWSFVSFETNDRGISSSGDLEILASDELSNGDGISVEAYSMDEDGNLTENGLLSDGAVMPLGLDGARSSDQNGDGVFTVVLDPGHGGYDPGACANGLRESDLTLRIAQYCREELSRYAKTQVYMTRESDVFVGLEERSQYAKSVSADLFVSLHINSSSASSAKGAEIWIPSPGSWYPAFNGVGEDLAQLMLDKFAALGLVDRGTQWDNYEVNGVKKYYPDGSWADSLSVIRNCRASGIMAVLVEHGFISNPSDASYLSSDYNLRQLGLADAESIVSYYGLKLPQPLYGFSDVYGDTAHSSEIGWLAASGVSTGFDDGTFRGGATVVRQDMAAFLYRLAGSPAYEPSAADKARFSDVSESTDHAREIWWLASTGISTGYSDGTFLPWDSVTRADMAAFMRRFAALYLDESSASYIPSDSDKMFFSDVNSSVDHADDIWWLGAMGISTGYDDGTYRPWESVVRQDMAAFLSRLNNLPVYTPTDEDKKSFSDVDDATAHADDIWWLAASGVSTGFDDGTFRGGASVARQDMAAFLYRLAGSPAYEPSAADKARFSDVSESTDHAREIWWLASTGISTGYSDGTFLPWDSVTRADMAAFMRRYYEKFAVGSQFKDWTPNDKSMLRFADVDSATSHADDIWWLGATGIAMGFSDSSFGPWDAVARQDMAAFLHRLDVRANRGEDASSFTIMGSSNCTVDQMVGYYNDSKVTYPSKVYSSKGAASIADFARIVIEEAEMEGVKAEVVFCQAMKETGWLKFGGSVKPEQCNFAGLGATDSSVSGAVFPDVRTGVRAQVQHLKAYASTEPLVNPCVDERFKYVQRGSAPTLTGLNGKWAVPGDGYGESIYKMISTLKSSYAN